MSTGTREEQRAELEALRSIYDESHVMFSDGICLSGKVVVEMEPLMKPLTVYVTTEKVELFYHQVLSGRESVVLTNLPPVVFMFKLPPEYPLVRPELELECEWMSEELDMERIELLRRVDDSGARSADYHFKSVCHDCEVCFQCKPGTQCLLFRPCQHVFCKECVTTFFFEILDSQQIRPLGCLAFDCSSLASQQAIQSIIGEKEFERYERILLEQALAAMDDVVPCPRKMCQNPVFVSERTPNLASCGMCGYSFCVLCYRAYHGLNECHFKDVDKENLVMKWHAADENERIQMGRRFGGLQNLQKVIDTILSEGWIDGNSKPCPRCRIRIEKTGGCNKMQCSKCDAMFCWLCYCILDKNNPYLHYVMKDSNCANRLFEGITTSEDEDDENFEVDWENVIEEESENDDDVEVPLV